MAFISQSRIAPKFSGDAMDRALAIAWIVSEIAVDVFGMFFWAALALLAVQAA
jgi:hypothetical protein